jgi:hypothetical protein
MKKKNVKKELFKARKFKHLTPGQDRDFETLDANRMFKAYEDVEIDEGPPSQKFKPLKHKVWSADASIPADHTLCFKGLNF